MAYPLQRCFHDLKRLLKAGSTQRWEQLGHVHSAVCRRASRWNHCACCLWPGVDTQADVPFMYITRLSSLQSTTGAKGAPQGRSRWGIICAQGASKG